MPDELSMLHALSARVGADPLLVQAAGGNTSLKQHDTMWIKASGTWLRDAIAHDIFVPVNHTDLMLALRDNDQSCETCTTFVSGSLNTNGLRPSIETTVHALMPQRVVVHVHCVNTIAWAIQRHGETALAEKLASFNWAYIPYARPGLPLAAAISQRLKPDTDVLVLGNHGLVVAAESVDDAEVLLGSAVRALHRPARANLGHDAEALRKACAGTRYRPAVSPETHALATDMLALKYGADAVFYPDHVVFLGVGVATSFKDDSPLVALSGIGVAIHVDAKPAVEPMARCLADVMRRVDPCDELHALTADDIDRLVNWDAEKYRQTLDAGS